MTLLYSLKWVASLPAQLKDNELYLYPDPEHRDQWAFAFKKDKKQVTVVADNPLKALQLSLQSLNSTSEKGIYQFDYAEHYSIGQTVKDILKTNFPEDQLLADGKVQLANGMSIELAELYALMGDFFGLPDKPIAEGEGELEQQQRFIKAFETLYGKDNQSNKEKTTQQTLIKNVLLIGAIQKEALQIAKLNCKCKNKAECNCAQTALEEIADMTNRLWNAATGGSNITYPLSHSTYLALSKNNIDHFSRSAKASYQAGHENALAIIRKIPHVAVEEQTKLIHKALAMEAAAGHFLTDLFSSGHVRVPRKELYDLKTLFGISIPASITGIFTLVMHNEDGENGVWVNDELTGEAWQAFGDDTLLTGRGKENRIKACTAARIGMLELVREIRQARLKSLVDVDEKADSFPETDTIYKLFPTACAQAANDKGLNHPLFKIEEGRLKRRQDVNNPLCGDYVENWWVWSTFLLLLPKALAYAYPNWFSHMPLTAATEGQKTNCDKENRAYQVYQQQKEIVSNEIEKNPSSCGSTTTVVTALGGFSQSQNNIGNDSTQSSGIDDTMVDSKNLLEDSGSSEIHIEEVSPENTHINAQIPTT